MRQRLPTDDWRPPRPIKIHSTPLYIYIYIHTFNSSSLAACNPCSGCFCCVCAVTGNVFSDRSSVFTVCFTFCKNVHAGGRMRQGEKTYVLYSQTVQRNASRQQRWRGRKEMSSRVKQQQPGEGRFVGVVELRCREYTFFSSHMLYIHTHRGLSLFKRAVLKLYSCPCALPFTYAVDGWRTEPNVSTWAPALWGAAKKTSSLIAKRDRAWKSDRFHSFWECLQCCSLRGANQEKRKKILHDDIFRSELARVLFCFATVLVEFINPSIEICARRALALSSMPYFLSVSHTLILWLIGTQSVFKSVHRVKGPWRRPCI